MTDISGETPCLLL